MLIYVLFLWFETEINRIPSPPKKATVNIYILLEWIKGNNNFSTPTPSPILFAIHHPPILVDGLRFSLRSF